MSRTYIISHAEDVDGISSAAIALAANPGATFKLVDYNTFIRSLSKVPSDTTSLIICDLGASSVFQELIMKLRDLKKQMSITYIDHHPLNPDQIALLKHIGVKVIHDPVESASVLTYFTLEPAGAPCYYLPIYGAVTDYMDSGPKASYLIDRVHRHFALLESTLLSSAVAQGRTMRYRKYMVRELARGKYPHEIKSVVRNATATLRKDIKLSRYVEQHARITGNIASVNMPGGNNIPAGAKMALGRPGVIVGIAYEQKRRGNTAMSLRGVSSCPVHLGDFIGEVARRVGGRGGGHRLAAGAKIPVKAVQTVITELSLKLK